MENKDLLEELVQTEEDKKFNEKIEKSMAKKLTRKVYKRLLLGILTVILLLGVCHVGMSYAMYNPLKEDVDFNSLLNAYLWTNVPENQAGVWEIKSKLFGRYEIMMKVHDLQKTIMIGDNYPVTIQNSTIGFDELRKAGLKLGYLNEFDYVVNGYTDEYEVYSSIKENLLKELDKLPDSAIIYATVNLNTRLDLDQALELIKKYPSSKITWLAMEQPDYCQGLTTGINLRVSLQQDSIEEYPHFDDLYENYSNELTADILKNYYLDCLKMLVDHPEFYNMMIKESMNASYNRLVEQYEFSKETQNCVGFRIQANRKDLKDLIESGMVSYVFVYDVKLSIYSN